MKWTVFLLLYSLTIYSKTVHVRADGRSASIKSALIQCSDGDTILIASGIYKEGNIQVSKSVFIKGIDYPVFDGEYKHEIFSVEAPNVIIEGLHLKHSGRSDMNDIAGIKLYTTKNVIVRNNILDFTFFGIYLMDSENCTIENNRITSDAVTEQSSGNGIHLWKSRNILIKNNRIKGHRDGIYFEFVTDTKINNNLSENNIRYGLHFMYSHDNEYHKNTFKNNGAGVAVMYTKRVKMTENNFIENKGSSSYGLLLKDISDSYLSKNVFSKNSIGIYMEESNRIEVTENLFESNGWALKVQASCSGNKIEKNNFIGNSFDIATNGSLVMNSFNGNYWDKYEGYDLNKDKIGDIPYHPVSMFSMIIEKIPFALMLYRSFVVTLLDKAEKIIPSITPIDLKDEKPLMKKAVL